MPKYSGVSSSVTHRLPRYYRCLEGLMLKGVERISSREFAEMIGLTASQIRQDLNCFGGFGRLGYGYNVAALHTEIGRILQVDGNKPIILVGAGNLGMAIVRQMKFEALGFRLLAVFDNDSAVIGKKMRHWTVLDTAGLEAFCREHNPVAAVLCVPEEATATMAGKLIGWGIRGFWNFTHYDFSVNYGDSVAVENVRLGDSLMTLSFHVKELLENP